jgi:hypothetical protein
MDIAQKLIHQIAVRAVDLRTVEPSVQRQHGSPTELFHGSGYLLHLERAGLDELLPSRGREDRAQGPNW